MRFVSGIACKVDNKLGYTLIGLTAINIALPKTCKWSMNIRSSLVENPVKYSKQTLFSEASLSVFKRKLETHLFRIRIIEFLFTACREQVNISTKGNHNVIV